MEVDITRIREQHAKEQAASEYVVNLYTSYSY